jgi:uncharacterized hydrophobic protein (TIGR00271 family)
MLHLRVYGASGAIAAIGERLEGGGAARHVALAPGVRADHTLLTAEITPESTDEVLEYLLSHGVEHEDIAFARFDEVGTSARGRADTSLIWADVLGQAARNARPVARYLVFMIVAGVISAFGVINVNGILIVGAMAVSPDTLPVAATCVGLVTRDLQLAWRAVVTLLVGLAATCVAAGVLTVGLDLFDDLPSGFAVTDAALSGLTTINSATIGVALAAGIAGMLAFETRAAAAVGVAISVTTIPAAAYLGVAAGVGELDKAWGALGVLAVNMVLLLVGGTVTLLVQRWAAQRQGTTKAISSR